MTADYLFVLACAYSVGLVCGLVLGFILLHLHLRVKP